MLLKPLTLEHGEKFYSLTVLEKEKSGRYRCGCVCGFAQVRARANALMKGRVKACRKCSSNPQIGGNDGAVAKTNDKGEING